MSYDEFLSQECYVFLSRVTNTSEQSTRSTRAKRTIDLVDSDSESDSSYRPNSSARRMSSRNSRKRASGEVEEQPTPSVNKARGGPLSLKRVKFGLNYDPDKDKLTFIPVSPERYNLMTVIVKPTYSGAVYDCIIFPLTKFQSKKINVDNYCVLLRLAYFNKQDDDYEDIFDYGMNIRVNNVPLPLTAPTDEDPNAPLDGPADITRYLLAEGNSMEKIEISFEGQAKPHIFSVMFCKRKNEELPYVKLGYQKPNETFKLAHRINERFMSDPDKVFRKVYTLEDPLTKQRISTPVRGHSCRHVECFDQDTFLRANQRKLEWLCPTCSNTIKEDQLIVDGLFNLILAKTYTSCTSVELDSQGGWSPIYNGKVFRVRTVDLEEGTSEGEDEEEEEEMRTPEEPLSPVDVPPEPEEPEIHHDDMNGLNGGGDDMNVSREVETQTQTQDWTQFEVEKDENTPMDQNDHENSNDRPEQSAPEYSHSSPSTTVIQRVDDPESRDDE